MSEAVAGLRDFSRRLRQLADVLDGEDFPSDDHTQAEGVRHLTRQLVMALQSNLEFGDPHTPVLHSYEQPWVQWGGPNPDNVYQRCAIDPMGTYRLSGNVSTIDNAIISLVDGDMHVGHFGVFNERTLKEFAITPDGMLDVIISPDRHAGNWIPTDPAARMLLVRQYLSDWDTESPAKLFVERIDAPGVDPSQRVRLTGAAVAQQLDAAMHWVEQSMTFWRNYVEGARSAMQPNVFGPPATPPGGAPNIAYGAGWWSLHEGLALVISSECPDADYWSWTIHTRYWLESGDFAHRQTSLNHRQIHVDDDGLLRIVVCATDPGVPNWIDISDHPEGLLVYRYVGARTKPVPVAEVVRLDHLMAHLPSNHPTTSPQQRREILRRRCVSVVTR
jgi:hypothetical protein